MNVIKSSKPNCSAIRIELMNKEEIENLKGVLDGAVKEFNRHPFGLKNYQMREDEVFLKELIIEIDKVN